MHLRSHIRGKRPIGPSQKISCLAQGHIHAQQVNLYDPWSMATPDLLLLHRVQQRDQAAFAQLYDDFSAALYGTVLRVLNGDEGSAQEVLQDAFVKIWTHASGYDPSKGRPFTWMMNIARNTAIDRLRSADMRKASAIRSLDSHVYHLAADTTQDTLDGADVVKVLQGLKPEHREIIDMAYYQGFTQQEIAERTSIPLGTVKSRTRAALTELRTLLKDHQ